MQVDHGDRRAVARRRRTSSPRPGACATRFAGRTRAPRRSRYGRSRGRRQMWLPSVITSAPAASSLSASFGVIPTPSAAFSPFTMQKSTSSSSRSAGQALLERPAARARRTRRRRRGASGQARVGRRDGPRRVTWLPASLRVARECLALDLREVEHLAELRCVAAATVEPTVSDGSGSEVGDARRRATAPSSGWMSMRAPCAAPSSDVRRVMPTIVPSTGA